MPGWRTDQVKSGETFSGQGPVDATPRLYIRRISTGPLYVVVGKPVDAVFRQWQREVIRLGAIMGGLILFVLGTTLFLAREISRRAQAEDKLEELATTDSLTGLRNRRKFDTEIDNEWRRAARQKTPLALLMIDADHFKAYNDTYGHQAGDQVLVGIAICISDSVGRAGDCAARYGGEEFAVLLPGCSAPDALAVAEKIRLKVAAMVGWADRQHGQHRHRQPDAECRRWTGRCCWKPPTRRSTPPRPAAATSRCVASMPKLSLVA